MGYQVLAYLLSYVQVAVTVEDAHVYQEPLSEIDRDADLLLPEVL